MLRWLIGVLTVLVVAACSSNPPAEIDASGTTAPDANVPTCPSGYAMCNGTCAPTKRDPDNCGTCGTKCKAGEVCVQGGCALQCGGGAIKCGNACVTTKSDPANCGACGAKCPSGQVCSAGKCATSCAAGLTDCSGSCLDLQTDDDNCGMCGNACALGQRCSGGTCVATCQQGLTVCSNTCVDTKSDPKNCGMCGNQCPQGQFCSNGTCGLGCFGGTTKCGNICVDTAIDPNNCGGCNQVCNGTCFNGTCCSGNLVYCGGACRDLKTDKNNCGACGVVCGGPCNNGVCCGNGEVICSGKCSNTAFDPQNCGSCGNVCPMNQPSCANSTCTTSQIVSIFPPSGTLQDPGNSSVWGGRYYTVTFSQPKAILAIEWRANLSSNDFVRGGIWNPQNMQKLATGSQVTGNNSVAYYRSTINFSAAANTPYLVGVFMSNVNTVFPRKDSPSFPFTTTGITVSACWSTGGSTDVFPTSSNVWGPDFRLEIQ